MHTITLVMYIRVRPASVPLIHRANQLAEVQSMEKPARVQLIQYLVSVNYVLVALKLLVSTCRGS